MRLLLTFLSLAILTIASAQFTFKDVGYVGTLAKRPAASSLVSSNNMVSYLKLESNLNDGFQTAWTDNGGITYGTGIIGNGVNTVRATPSFISHSDIALGSSWTVCFWVKFANVSSSMWIVNKTTDNSEGMAMIMESGASIDLYIGGPYLLTSSSSISSNTWYFVVAKQDSNTQYLKINNGAWNSAANDGYTDNAANWKIGASYNDDSAADAIFDEVSIWNRALTDQEITQLYNSGAAQRPQLP